MFSSPRWPWVLVSVFASHFGLDLPVFAAGTRLVADFVRVVVLPLCPLFGGDACRASKQRLMVLNSPSPTIFQHS